MRINCNSSYQIWVRSIFSYQKYLKPTFKTSFWICVIVLWIHKGYFEVKNWCEMLVLKLSGRNKYVRYIQTNTLTKSYEYAKKNNCKIRSQPVIGVQDHLLRVFCLSHHHHTKLWYDLILCYSLHHQLWIFYSL